MFWKKKAPRDPFPIPRDTDLHLDPFRPQWGWTEIWEHGHYLGLVDGMERLERYIQSRPGRDFYIRFIQRPIGCAFPALEPIGSFRVRSGKYAPQYFQEEMR